MSDKNEQTGKRTRRKWPWIVLLCLIVIIGLARLALVTGPAHRWVKNSIVSAANNQLNPQLSIGNLSGDLWSEVTLTDLVLTEDSTVATVDTLYLEYSPLSYFGDAFRVHEIRIVSPSLNVRQEKDGTWNVQNWLASSDAPSDSTGKGFTYSISNLVIERGRIDVAMSHMTPDSAFIIDNLNLAGSLAYLADSYEATVADLNFAIKRTRLDVPVRVTAAADADESSVSLEKLVIATGQSLLNASGEANLADSTAQFEAHAKPLGWKDVAAYAEELPAKKNIDVSLRVNGDAQQWEVGLDARAEGIEQLTMHGNFQRDSVLALTSLQASASRLDLVSFFGDTAMPDLQNIEFKARGRIPLNNYRQSRVKGTLSATHIHQGSYRLDAMQGSFTLNGGNADIRLEPAQGREQMIATADLSQIWSEQPNVEISVRGSKINPANWLQYQSYTGTLTFNAELSGTGWYPDQNVWNYRLSVNNSRIADQSLEKAIFSGRFSKHVLTNRSEIMIGKSKLNLQASVKQLQTRPDFSYTLNAHNVNLADFKGLSEYPSSITGTVKGKGHGSSVDNLQMQATVQTDTSVLKGEFIREFTLALNLADNRITINEGNFSSTIADAEFEGQFHLSNFYSADNRLDLMVQIKDISSFASNADADILKARGTIEGQVIPAGRDSLVFDGRVDLEDVNYNNQFIAPKVSGNARVDLEQDPGYLLDFKIESPMISDVKIQNFSLQTQGRVGDTETSGSFELELSAANEGRIFQRGDYTLNRDFTEVTLTEFDLTSAQRTLSLEKPFNARFADGVLQTDTLRIHSKNDSAFLSLAVPFADSLRQQAWLKGQNLNLAVIQDAILDEPIFEGKLFGEVNVNRTDTSLQASGDMIISELLYRETELDTLQLQAQIKNERLTGMMKLRRDGELVAEGEVDAPFRLPAPSSADEAFFQQPVSGYFKLNAIELEHYRKLLQQAGYDSTEGILQFSGRLEGQVGHPGFNARLTLKKAKLSGVQIDSLIATMNYRHEESTLDFNATLTSLKQKALEAQAIMPLKVDLSKPEVALPGPKDSITVDIQTNWFNLKALNDFMNRDIARNLEGRVNGNVKITGPRENLQTSGRITLQKGAVRLVNAGIRLDNIRSSVRFERDRIFLENLRMKSGNGALTAKGELGLEKLVPGDLDISLEARNFKAANTDEYNALINLDLKVNGSVTRPDVSGNLEVINGFVELQNFGEKSVEKVELDTTLTPETESTLYDSLSLNLDFEFNRRFYVRNQRYLEMEIELEGQLDVLKDAGEDLQLFGTLQTADGYARPLGKRFELEEGSLAFSGPPDNPQINVRTLYEPPQADQEVKIWYVIEGTVEDPRFKYESSPPMDLAGIISYTLFGQPFYKLNPAEQSVASSTGSNAAADFAVEVLLDRVESLATGRLGIDVVRIENTRIGGDSGTSITTGWYINPKVFFAIQNVITGSTPTTGFYLEYYLQENLKLILSQGNENRQGVDVQWEYDY